LVAAQEEVEDNLQFPEVLEEEQAHNITLLRVEVREHLAKETTEVIRPDQVKVPEEVAAVREELEEMEVVHQLQVTEVQVLLHHILDHP
jgi:predicted glycosyltransferase